jgi:heat shock protein HslJ
MIRTVFSASLFICVLLLSACSPSASKQSSGGDLTSQVWGLTELLGKPPVAGTGISAQFTTDGKLSGSAGCNRYAGSYTVSGSNLTIATPLASTMMMCDQDVMAQETIYLITLGEAKTFTVKQDKLTLMSEDGKALATYQAESQDLAGSDWEVTGYNNGKQAVVSVLAGTSLTASFGKDGALSGNSGCNTFSGPYTLDGNQITIGPLASTMMMCSDPAGVMDQEAQYLAALQSAATYQREGNVLELRTKDGALAATFSKK